MKSSGTASSSCSDAANIGNILDFTYNFSLGSSDNGNVTSLTNSRDTTRSQSFSYDQLNRLATAQTSSTYSSSPAHCWGESFGYDQWANFLTIGVASSSYNGCTQESLSITANAQNRVSTSGYVYDTAGNLTNTPNPGGATAQRREPAHDSERGRLYVRRRWQAGEEIERHALLVWHEQ